MTIAERDYQAGDDAVRAQIRDLLRETLFVEAGAGTGKTRALVDRYVALVLSGKPVERLIAITFTEKAAAELRDRVRGELERRQDEESTRELVATALSSLDRAPISTIHAFAAGALRTFAAEAGIDPAFEVNDEVTSERRFEEKWRTYLEDLAGDNGAIAAIERCLALGMTTANIETLARELWYNTGLAEQLDREGLTAPRVPPLDLEVLRRELAELQIETVVAGDLLVPKVQAVMRLVDLLIDAPPDERESFLASIAWQLEPRGLSVGRAPNWTRVPVAAARDTIRRVLEFLSTLLDALRSEALSDLLPVVLRFVVDEAQARARDGALTFDDLILRLRDILRDSQAARFALRDRYDALLIDEFQDTDPLQVDIALSFGRRGDDERLEPGRLFLVGDPKQSIYRFRRADMAIYEQTRQRVEGSAGAFPVLALNRRSRTPLIEWVNAVFERVIGAGDNPSVQPLYRAIYAHRDVELVGPSAALIGDVSDEQARDVRRFEAQQVAAYCREAVRAGWQVAERNGDVETPRPARYRDIAVLIPTRTVLQPLERSLADAGIPYRVEGGSLVYGTQEVRDIINCLTALDDPTDDVAVVGALRSPAYACSDVELAAYRLGGGSFNYLSPALAAMEGRVATGLQNLRRFHERRHDSTLAALVEAFVSDRGLVDVGIYDAGNRDAFRRARFVVEQARAFEASRPESLRAFVAWLERRAGDAILDQEGAALDDDEDAVRILTVHGAKGLEFPIVFLAGISAGPNLQPSVLNIDRASGEVAISIGAKTRKAQFTLGDYAAVYANEQQHIKAERDRLLYVAATRARDHLVVSLYHPSRAKESGAQRLIECGARETALELPGLPVLNVEVPPLDGLRVDVPAMDETLFEATRTALVASAHRQTYTSATALGREVPAIDDALTAGAGDEDAPQDKNEREDETEPWARGRAGTHRGRAVHAALQSLPWDADDATIEAVANAQATAESIPNDRVVVAALIRNALRTEAASRARMASRALREVPFAFPLRDGAVVVEGFIDLVIESQDGTLEVVDWKTDHVTEDTVEARLQKYRTQAGLYVLGLERAAPGRVVSRVTYVFVDPLEERSPGEPAELAAAALERLTDGDAP